MHRTNLIALGFCLAAALAGFGAAKKKEVVTFRVHGEGSKTDHEKMVTQVTIASVGRSAYMQTIPVISERDVTAFYPFPAMDGSMGAYFKLDAHGRNILEQHTLSKTGKFLIVLVNGRQAVELLIDQGVRDGILSIPRGLTVAEVELLRQRFPIIGEEGAKGKTKKPKAPKEKASPPPARNALP